MSLLEQARKKYATADFEPTQDVLREMAGPDWDEIKSDPDQLEAARYTARKARQIAAGVVPESFTATSKCSNCGAVPVWPGYPSPTNSCPWCFNRRKGLPIPHPQTTEQEEMADG
jgi:hypothetical protein